MNERIWELFRQANHPHPKHGGNDMFFPEEFAALIVTECMEIAYEYDEPKMSGPGMIIAGRIEQHFGVENE